MQIIKLDATDSTNKYLKDLMLSNALDDYTVVTARAQYNGRGQMGAIWESEVGKNLTFSVLKKFNDLPIAHQFHLNICVSLAIFNALKNMSVPDLSVKWPNDILSGTTKICGILIENILLGNKIQTSVIGIGLNVNQTNFNTLINASSLKLLLGRTIDLDELLHTILMHIKAILSKLQNMDGNTLWATYEDVLFRKDKPSTFQDENEEMFMGFIRGVSPLGKLKIELEDTIVKEFDLKQVKLLY